MLFTWWKEANNVWIHASDFCHVSIFKKWNILKSATIPNFQIFELIFHKIATLFLIVVMLEKSEQKREIFYSLVLSSANKKILFFAFFFF